jgi:uncharacterized C2H2 Zn-finger protein
LYFSPEDIDFLVSNKTKEVASGFLCLLCGTVVGRRPNMRRHLMNAHIKGEEYLCPKCDKVYKSKQSFSGHVYAYHKEWKGVKMEEFIRTG